jgi:hypothetical protein
VRTAHAPQECYADTKKKLDACSLHLERVYCEAEKIVKQLLHDHEALGFIPITNQQEREHRKSEQLLATLEMGAVTAPAAPPSQFRVRD